MERGSISPLSERFRILVRSIGVVVSTPTANTATVTCEMLDDFQRARGRIDAAIQMLHISANVEVRGLVMHLTLGDPT